uniref:BTB domain-containing protein n=1 Tax=Panagrolaimus sp. ES5 TaxID=591445 RepID=A0AC34FS11_9BILA
MCDTFKAQDPENGNFNVVFEIDEKKLYAHSLILSFASTTFESMLSNRWTKPGESIAIKDYTFENFKEFLTFLYSGACELTDENIFAMVDIAEFYNITVFKENCEEYLTKMQLNLINIYQMIEIVIKYSLVKFKEFLKHFVLNNLSLILKSALFQGVEKPILNFIVESSQEAARQEELFEAVYKWAENRAIRKLEIKKSFLFSGDELSDILCARSKVFVKVIDVNGKVMKGELQCGHSEKFADIILSQKNTNSSFLQNGGGYCYWNTERSKPSTPSKLTKSDKIEWYLVYDEDGDLAVGHRHDIGDSYLLAEMSAENGFKLSKGCKIESFCFA